MTVKVRSKTRWMSAMSAARNTNHNTAVTAGILLLAASVLFPSCTDKTNFNVLSADIALKHLRVRASSGKALWELRSKAPVAPAYIVHYGVVPDGFVQIAPPGRPRPLASGEKLSVMLVTDGTVICVHAHALGSTSIAQDNYETIPPIARSIEARAALDRITRCDP
jgi:hypothetical protein